MSDTVQQTVIIAILLALIIFCVTIAFIVVSKERAVAKHDQKEIREFLHFLDEKGCLREGFRYSKILDEYKGV